MKPIQVLKILAQIINFGFHAVADIFFTRGVHLLTTGNLINMRLSSQTLGKQLSIEMVTASDVSTQKAKEGQKLLVSKQEIITEHHPMY